MARNRFLHRIPLTIKMVLLTLVVGGSAWAALDYFQTRTLKSIFLAQLEERLNREAQEDRIRFDNYIKAHHQSVKLIASQKRFVDYVAGGDWARSSEVVFHSRPPRWLPRSSVLRSLVRIRHALLLDASGRTREVYQGEPVPLPKTLLHPTDLLRQLTHNQSFMTYIEGAPYLVTSESLKDDRGKLLATLMLASPLDREFLLASQGPYHVRIFALLTFALLTGDRPRILISTDPDVLPSGTPLDDLEDRFLVTGKSLFDYGASDLLLGFASFISMEEVESLTRSVISRDRQQRAITAFILITAFALIMFLITKRIGRLTEHVSDFTERVLHRKPRRSTHGDEMDILEEQFRHLMEEVVSSQEIIRRDYHFQSAISSILQISLEPVSFDRQLERIMDTILSMPFLSVQSKGCIYLVEDDPGMLVMRAQHGLPESVRRVCARVPFGKCLCGRAVSGHEIVFAESVNERHEITCEGMSPHGHYVVPISSGKKILGALSVYLEEGHKEKPEEVKVLSSVANTLAAIIERRQAEQEKKKLQDQLIQTEKLSALGRMTSNIAHEIRNPLTALGGLSRRLDRKVAEGTREKEYTRVIVSEAERLERILRSVDAFLEEAGPRKEDLDLAEIIEESMKAFTDLCRKRSIIMEGSFGDVPRVQADREQVRQVIDHLISNAVDAMPDGGRITIATGRQRVNGDQYVRVKVSDTGQGIAADHLEQIFEPFFTTKAVSEGTAVGLGLSVCKKIMDRHDGFIKAESEVGKGSAFSLFFPYMIRGKSA